jgi:ribosome maturation factor RimP
LAHVFSCDEEQVVSEAGLESVRAAVEPAVRDLGADLYDVELIGGSARTLRVTITRDGGVDLDLITEVTRAVSPIVDEADAVSGSYLLEVSSPGVERSLRRAEHFRGAVGEEVAIKLRTDGATRRVHGILTEADAGRCRVTTDDGAVEEFAIDDITQARTQFSWGSPRGAKAKQRGEARA